MGFFQNRRMIQDSITNATCTSVCEKYTPIYLCPTGCFDFCQEKCVSTYHDITSPPPSPSLLSPHHNSHRASTFLTATIALLAASFLIVCGYALYAKYYSDSRRNDSSPITPDDHETRERPEFLDEEQGGTVEHHVWYIRTVGLEPSEISSITALKYRKDEGLVESTDCSVCLSEFQEDDGLRLLPKCSHAFHVACIDTWLRSHTNCPMCRAQVLSSAVKPSSPEASTGRDSGSEEETRMEISASHGENIHREVEEGDTVENCDEIHGVEPSRRSVSLDCLDVKELEVVDKLRNNNGEKKLQRLRSGGSSNGKSCHRNGHVSSSSSSMKRSHSCNGKFVMCRQIRITDSILPLRSV